jgi:hypothetical protein
MKTFLRLYLPLIITFTIGSCAKEEKETSSLPNSIFKYQPIEPRWSSPENINGKRGDGGKENNGAKGRPSVSIEAGETFELLNVHETGFISRIWITIDDRSPDMLRSLKLDMYWDDETKPAVSVPFGDFFSVGLGRTTTFENEFFASPEGRSFNCFIPMPFRKAAKIEKQEEMIENEDKKKEQENPPPASSLVNHEKREKKRKRKREREREQDRLSAIMENMIPNRT